MRLFVLVTHCVIKKTNACNPGGPFAIDKLDPEDLKAGQLKSSWAPTTTHSSIPDDQVEEVMAMIVSGLLMGISAGALSVSDEWNRLLPDYKFTQAEEFLAEAWKGKP